MYLYVSLSLGTCSSVVVELVVSNVLCSTLSHFFFFFR